MSIALRLHIDKNCQSITHADQSGDAGWRIITRTTAADALHQSGQRAESGALFAEAERLQQERQPVFDLLYSLRGFQYCDWLLAPAEQAAWRALLAFGEPQGASHGCTSLESRHEETAASALPLSAPEALAEFERRAHKMFDWRVPSDSLLDIALDHLTLACVGLIRAIMEAYPTNPTLDLPHVAAAVNGLRAAGQMGDLPRGLLTAAIYHFVRGEPALVEKHLAEAQQIAERGPMPLFLADIHLTRARLFRNREELAKAAHLIRTLGYGRRFDELADADEAAKVWSC